MLQILDILTNTTTNNKTSIQYTYVDFNDLFTKILDKVNIAIVETPRDDNFQMVTFHISKKGEKYYKYYYNN